MIPKGPWPIKHIAAAIRTKESILWADTVSPLLLRSFIICLLKTTQSPVMPPVGECAFVAIVRLSSMTHQPSIAHLRLRQLPDRAAFQQWEYNGREEQQ